MEPRVLNRVVFVKDPTALPSEMKHHEAIDSLAKANKVVILLSHGNPYILPVGWLLPHNVKLIEYDLTVKDIETNVVKVREILKQHGIDLYSRHLDNDDPMPMLLAGACMTMGPEIKVAFVNKPNQFSNIKQADTTNYEGPEWDLL